MTAHFGRPLQLFTGKGGVGKSTVIAAVALALARRGRRPLVVELGGRAAFPALVGSDPVGSAPGEVAPGVSAMNLSFPELLRDYSRRRLPVRRLADAVADSEGLRRLLEAAPGVDEALTLERIEHVVTAGAFDPVLVDLDATGHALMFLELPSVLDGLVGRGPLHRALTAGAALLGDPDRTGLHVVTLARPLVVDETLELLARVTADRIVAVGAVIANALPDRRLSAAARRLSETAPADEPVLVPLRRAMREGTVADEQVARLRRFGVRPVCLARSPALDEATTSPARREAIEALGVELLEAT